MESLSAADPVLLPRAGEIVMSGADIVYAIDERCAIPLSVSLRSVQENSGCSTVKILILCDDVSDETKDRITRSAAKPEAVRFFDVPLDTLPAHHAQGVTTRISRAAFSYLSIGPEQVNPRRFVYLDADTVVRVDITSLLDTDVRDKALGAVYDHTYTLFDRQTGRLAGSEPMRRFNTGVILIATGPWFHERIGERAMRVACAQKITDQGALNVACAGRWHDLDRGWNVTTQALLLDKSFRKSPHKVLIRHLTAIKPWLGGRTPVEGSRLMLDEFHDYLSRTTWRIDVPPSGTAGGNAHDDRRT